MITRIWHGWTTKENADAYEALLKSEIMPGIYGRQIAGFNGMQLLRREMNDEVEFITVMRFNSMAAVRAFAGEDYKTAVVPPKARALLSRYDQQSTHYENVVAGAESALTETANITDEMQRVWEGDTWHGPALREILAGVTAEQAAARPLSNAHSIWELVLHIAAWEDVFCRRLRGERVDEPEEGDFPPVDEISADAWAQALARMKATHERLLAIVAGLSDAALNEGVIGKDYTVRFMLHGIIRHNVYHAGQIALLKKQ